MTQREFSAGPNQSIVVYMSGDMGAEIDPAILYQAIAADVLAARRARWTPPAPRYKSGVMAKYAAQVSSASLGAVTTGERMTAQLKSAGATK